LIESIFSELLEIAAQPDQLIEMINITVSEAA